MVDHEVPAHKGLPAELAPAIESARTAASFQDAADALRKQASVAWDPAERERLIRSAYEKETAAHGESKKARGEYAPRPTLLRWPSTPHRVTTLI